MNSTQMRDAIAKALGMNPADIKVVSCEIGINDTDDMTCQEIYDSFSDRAPKNVANAANKVILEPKATDQAVPAPSTWAMSQQEREAGVEKLKAAIHPDQPKNINTNLWAAATAQLEQQITNLQVANRELTTRNDRQCATINELHEKLAGGEELADKKARRKSLLQSVLLAQALMSDIFDEHDALTGNEPFPEEVLESINTELDLIFQRIHNLGEYVTRNL